MTNERAKVPAAARATFEATRRGVLSGGAAVACLGLSGVGRAGGAPAAPRLAAIDWAMLETTLALGVAPVAAAELILFRKAAVEPATPDEVADLGLRGSLNYEQLHAVRPDLILISPWYENRVRALSRVAPVASFSIYEAGRSVYAAAEAATRALGAKIDREAAAERAIADADAELGRAQARLAAFAGRPILVINLGDARHFRVFGADSMFGDVAARLGLASAWAAPTRFGAYPTVGIETLAGMPDATIVNVGPTPPAVLRDVRASPLWRAMPAMAAGRFVDLEAVNPYGALPAARRFARLLADGLSKLSDA